MMYLPIRIPPFFFTVSGILSYFLPFCQQRFHCFVGRGLNSGACPCHPAGLCCYMQDGGKPLPYDFPAKADNDPYSHIIGTAFCNAVPIFLWLLVQHRC